MTAFKIFRTDRKCLQLFVMSTVCVLSLDPALAAGGLGETMDMTSGLVFEKLSPLILGVGCVVGCGYSIIKSSIMGVIGSLGTTAIAGYTLNSIQSGHFLKLLGE